MDHYLLKEDHSAFVNKCRQREHRFTLGFFGLDFILGKDGSINLIEINGQHSGFKGFEEAYGAEHSLWPKIQSHLASYGLPVRIFQYDQEDSGYDGVSMEDINQIFLNCSKEALEKLGKGKNFTDDEYYYIRKFLPPDELGELEKSYTEILKEELRLREVDDSGVRRISTPGLDVSDGLYSLDCSEQIIWNHNHYRFAYDESRVIAINPFEVQEAAENKAMSFLLFWNGMLPSYGLWPMQDEQFEDQVPHIFRFIKTPKVVIKPTNGKCGSGVVVLDKSDLLNSKGKLRRDFKEMIDKPEEFFQDENLCSAIEKLRGEFSVIQPYVESRDFVHGNGLHKGAVRYIVMVESNRGEINLTHFGGYARLAPQVEGIDGLVANIHRGAVSAPLSGRDKQRLKSWVDDRFPDFYRRALRVDLHDNFDSINYMHLDSTKKWVNEPWRF